MNLNPRLFFSVSMRVWLLGCVLAHVVRAQPAAPPIDRSIEVIGFGSGIGELRVFQGKELQTLTVNCIPPGPVVHLSGTGPVEFQRRVKAADGKETWTRVASVDLPATGDVFTAIVIPNAHPAEGELPYGVRLFPKPPKLPVGTCELTNYTPATLLVQLENAEISFKVDAWEQHIFTPKVDHKFRAVFRLAYRTTPEAEWKLVKSGIISLPPDQAMRSSFVFAASGMSDLIDADSTGYKSSASKDPALFLMENSVPAIVASGH